MMIPRPVQNITIKIMKVSSCIQQFTELHPHLQSVSVVILIEFIKNGINTTVL